MPSRRFAFGATAVALNFGVVIDPSLTVGFGYVPARSPPAATPLMVAFVPAGPVAPAGPIAPMFALGARRAWRPLRSLRPFGPYRPCRPDQSGSPGLGIEFSQGDGVVGELGSCDRAVLNCRRRDAFGRERSSELAVVLLLFRGLCRRRGWPGRLRARLYDGLLIRPDDDWFASVFSEDLNASASDADRRACPSRCDAERWVLRPNHGRRRL